MITVFKYCEREAVVRKGNEVNDRHGETALMAADGAAAARNRERYNV
jgi:hypothetical protein